MNRVWLVIMLGALLGSGADAWSTPENFSISGFLENSSGTAVTGRFAGKIRFLADETTRTTITQQEKMIVTKGN